MAKAKDDTLDSLRGDDLAYWKLGDFIFDENPYPQPRYPRNYKGKAIKRYGPGKSFRGTKKFGKISTVNDPALYLKGLFWNVGGTNVRVSKAIRIPYSYKQGKKTIKSALLIGYEGAGGGM
jgi:hypothetical protein